MGGLSFGPPPQEPSPEQEAARQSVLKNIREFKMKPREVKEFLDRFVIEQDDAKKVLSVALCDHYNWARRCIEDPDLRKANYTKPNILILGPTGSGKTYLVRTLAKMLGVPFAVSDATKFSETGIVGEDTEDVIRGLVETAGGDTELAQYGMVYIDEVDKIAGGGRGGGGGSWSGKQVQSNFLKIMEDTEVSVKNNLQASLGAALGGAGGGAEGNTISTKFILFIFSGAFNSLNDLIRDRVSSGSMGFVVDNDPLASAGSQADAADSPKKRSFLHLAETSDFTQAGLEPEFVGRVPVRVAIDALDADDLYRILTQAEDSILKQYENEFLGYGITLKPDKAGLRRLAELAVKEKTGARALVTVLEKALRDFKFDLPSTSCKELRLTDALVDDPRGTLNALLSEPEQVKSDMQRWLDDVDRCTGVRLDMADDVRTRITEECASAQKSAESVMNLRFRATGVVDCFKQLYDATDGKACFFTITMAMYDTPGEEIEKFKGSLEGVGA